MRLYVGVDNRIHTADGVNGVVVANGLCGTKRWTAVGSLVDLVDRSICPKCTKHVRHRQAAAASHGQDSHDGPGDETKADAW